MSRRILQRDLVREGKLMARHHPGLRLEHIETIIEEATRLLVEAAHPEKIILFGSHARGDFAAGNDLDLLIILPTVVDRFIANPTVGSSG